MNKMQKTSFPISSQKYPAQLILIAALLATGCGTFFLHNVRGFAEAQDKWYALAIAGYGGARHGITEQNQDFAIQQAAVLWHACDKLEEIHDSAKQAVPVRKAITEATQSEIARLEHEMNNKCALADSKYNTTELNNRRETLREHCGCDPNQLRDGPSNYDANCGTPTTGDAVAGTGGFTAGTGLLLAVPSAPALFLVSPIAIGVIVAAAEDHKAQCQEMYKSYTSFYHRVQNNQQACQTAKTAVEEYRKQNKVPGEGVTYDIYGDDPSYKGLSSLLISIKSNLESCERMKTEISGTLDEDAIRAEMTELLYHGMLPTNPNFDQDIHGTQGDTPGYVPPDYVPPS